MEIEKAKDLSSGEIPGGGKKKKKENLIALKVQKWSWVLPLGGGAIQGRREHPREKQLIHPKLLPRALGLVGQL